MLFLHMQGLFRYGSAENTALRTIGTRLSDRHARSVMLEPIGSIGFYSRVSKVYDLAGLVSPEVYRSRRTRRPGWFTEAVQKFQPEYVVLRFGEVERNLAWNVGPLFTSAEQRGWWERHYQLIEVIGEGTGNLDKLSLYKAAGGIGN
jgi:hypothetical protein